MTTKYFKKKKITLVVKDNIWTSYVNMFGLRAYDILEKPVRGNRFKVMKCCAECSKFYDCLDNNVSRMKCDEGNAMLFCMCNFLVYLYTREVVFPVQLVPTTHRILDRSEYRSYMTALIREEINKKYLFVETEWMSKIKELTENQYDSKDNS